MAPVASQTFQDLTVERRSGNIYIITLRRGDENKLTAPFCQEIIRAFHSIQREIGSGESGAVITTGSNTKFWCTGVELDDPDPWMSCDGFYPVSWPRLAAYIFLTLNNVFGAVASHYSRFPIPDCRMYNRPHLRWWLPVRTSS